MSREHGRYLLICAWVQPHVHTFTHVSILKINVKRLGHVTDERWNQVAHQNCDATW